MKKCDFLQAFRRREQSALFLLIVLTMGSTDSFAKLPPKPRTQIDIDKESSDMAWWRESMETRDERLAWWREARFGMFVCWGVTAPLGGEWKGVKSGYAMHIQRKAKIPCDVYRKEVAGKFNPTLFDADQWVKTLKNTGVRYLVFTAKFHDGFAMYDSDVSDYNIMEATPLGRDPAFELKEACRKYGVRFGVYYSHAFDWGEKDGPGNDWEYNNPGGDLKLHGEEKWYDLHPEMVARIRDNYVNTKAIPQVQEIIRKYDPDIMWFDTSSKLPPEELVRILKAVREAKPDIVVNSRIGGVGGVHWGDYKNTVDRPAEFYPTEGDWEGIPTTNEAYGWSKHDNRHKSVAFFIQLLAKAVARGGNTLMNIGPMGDGQIDPKDMAIMEGIGRWMDINSESIYGTERTPLPVQAWGESTLKGELLYLHVFDWPKNGKLAVGGLKSPVKKAWLLSDSERKELPVERTSDIDKVIAVPEKAPDAANTVVVVQVAGPVETDARRLLSATQQNKLRSFDAELIGKGLKYGSGKSYDSYACRWTKDDQRVRWNTRLVKPATYDVFIEYSTLKEDSLGRFRVRIGSETLEGDVVEAGKNRGTFVKKELGRVTLPAGDCPVEVLPVAIPGKELMRLRAVYLVPVSE